MAWSPFIKAFISICAISSGVRLSIPPEDPLPSPCCICSCISRHICSSSSSEPSTILYSGPRNEKYTSKTVSNERQWALFLTIVAPNAYLNASRSSRGMCRTASMASRFSVSETGSPALRSSWTNPESRSITLWTPVFLVKPGRRKVPWKPWRYQTDTSTKHAKSLWQSEHQSSQCSAASWCAPSPMFR